MACWPFCDTCTVLAGSVSRMVSSSLRAQTSGCNPRAHKTRLSPGCCLAAGEGPRGAQEANARRLGPQPGGARLAKHPRPLACSGGARFGTWFSLQQGWTPVVVLNGLAAVLALCTSATRTLPTVHLRLSTSTWVTGRAGKASGEGNARPCRRQVMDIRAGKSQRI